MSYHTLHTRPLNLALASYLKRGAHLGVGLGAMAPMLALANPSGGNVTAGQATITSPGANGLVVKQTSASAIINWQQFNIGKGQYVQFIQPNSSSVVLNRVVGGSASSIFGSLTGNGQVFLVNPNGVFFGRSATLDVQGFLASTLDISDSNFLAGHYVFDQQGAAGAEIINQGKLRAHNGGYIILAGDYAENDGLITAQSGHVILASGAKTTLNLNGNQLVNFAVNTSTLASFAGVENTGKLISDGGTVIMTADVANALKATVVNNQGLIEAHAISKSGGTISLTATGGNIENAGTLDANATKVGQQGGTITLKGDEKTILTPTSNITALGDAANGGHLEISGNTIAVKGNVSLGKRGSLLMDPGHVQISSASANSGGPASGSSATTGFGKVGVKFIESQLHANTNVTIAAGTLISASGAAKTKGITETTGTGNLKLLVGHGGDIELEGLNIAIAGRFSASVFNAVASHSHNAFMSFGRIQAKNISINAGASSVHLAAPATVGGVLHPSLKATGSSIAITAGNIAGISGTDINLSAKNAIVLHGQVSNAGNVDMTVTSASGEGIFAGKIISGKNIVLTATHLNPINSGGSLDISAASNLTVKGEIGTATDHMFGGLTLKAGKTISVNHGIYNRGSIFGSNIDIVAKHLVYTGAGNFAISAGFGNLYLDAGIGSAAHPVTYGVNLVDHGYGLYIERSIYTAAGITAAQTGSNSSAAPTGVFVRAGSDGSASIANVNNTTHTTSASSLNVTLKAGGNIALSGNVVKVGGGRAFARASHSGGAATAKNTVTIDAAKNVTFSGGSVIINGGTAGASIINDSKSTVTATADTSVTVHAGIDVKISASIARIEGGNAQVNDRTHAVKQSATATANANVTITAGGAIKTSDAALDITGGNSVAQKTTVHASSSSAKATATAHGNVSLSAPTITLNANRISVQGGSRVGGIGFGHTTCGGICSVSFSTVDHVDAKAKNAAANLTATGNVTLSATGNVTLTDVANGVFVSGGTGAGQGISISGGSKGGTKATADTESKVMITAGGAIKLKGARVTVHGGSKAAGSGTTGFHGSFLGSPTSGTNHVNAFVGGTKGASTKFTADASVTITAGGNVTLSASGSTGSLRLSGGDSAARGIAMNARSAGGKAAATVTSGVNVTSTKGNVTLNDTHYNIFLGGASDVGASAGVSAGYGAVTTLKADGSTNVNAHGAVAMTAGGHLYMSGSGSAASGAHVKAQSSSAAAAMTALGDVSVKAGTTLSLTATGNKIRMSGSTGAALSASVSAKGTGVTASLTADTGLHYTAGGAITMRGATSVNIYGGDSAADSATVHGSSHGVAKLNAFSGVNITAGGAFTAIASIDSIDFSAGSRAGASASVVAKKNGTATLLADGGMHITAGGGITLKGRDSVYLEASDEAGYKSHVTASSGGKASATALDNVNLTAKTGSITMTAGSGSMDISGSGSAGFSATVKAKGAGAKATLIANTGVAITTPGSLTLKAHTSLYIAAGDSAAGGSGVASHASVSASAGGNAALNAKTALNISVGGNLLASAGTSSISISAGEGVGRYAHVTGNKGTATLTADGGAYINVGGNFTMRAIHSSASMFAGDSAGYKASINATSAGVATETAHGNVSITVGGAFTVIAGSIAISAESFAAELAHVTATKTGSKATLTADGGINIKTGGTITLKAHDSMSIGGGGSAGRSAAVTGSSGGSAKLTTGAAVNITAGGNFIASAATSSIDMSAGTKAAGGSNSSHHATVTGNKGTAALSADAGINISAKGAISLTAGSSINMSGSGSAARFANVIATSGHATVTALGNVSLVAGGAFTAQAASSIIFSGGRNAAQHALDSATGTGATATLTADSSFKITAGGTISLRGNQGVSLSGSDAAGESAHVIGNTGGTAKLTANAAFNMTGGGSLIANGGQSYVYFSPGSAAGKNAVVTGNHGTATLTADGGVHINIAKNIIVTAASFDTFFGGASAGRGAHVTAIAGKATETAGNALTVTAGGVFTATAGSFMSIFGGTHVGQGAVVIASSAGAVATLNADASAHFKVHGGITLKANTSLHIGSGANSAQGASAGKSDTVTGHSHGVANVTALSSVDMAAGGAFTASAGSSLKINVGRDMGFNDNVIATTGTANLTVKGGVTVAAGGAFTARGGFAATSSSNSSIDINGGRSAGMDGVVVATGTKSIATRNVDASVTIIAGGAMIVKAAGSTDIFGGLSAGRAIAVTGTTGGTANETAKANVTIKAGGAFTDSGSSVNVSGGGRAGLAAHLVGSTGKAAFTGADGVTITAAGAMNLHALSYMFIAGASENGSQAHAVAVGAGATATFTADGTLNLTAAAINMNAGTDMSLSAGSKVAESALAVGSNHGIAKLTANGAVNLKATSGGITLKNKQYLEMHAGESNARSANAVATVAGSAAITGMAGLNFTMAGGFNASAGTGMSFEADYFNAFGAQAHATSAGAVAKVTATTAVKLTAGGAITMNGGSGDLSIYGNYSNAKSALVTAVKHGVATITADGSVTMKGKSVNLTAGSSLSIYGRYRNADGAGVHASSAGVAALTAKSGVNITATGGAFTAKAFYNMSIYESHANALGANVTAVTSGAKATLIADESVHIKAASVSLTGGSNLEVFGGFSDGQSAHVIGTATGTATLDAEATVTVAATGAFTAAGGTEGKFLGGGQAAQSALVNGVNGSAKLTTNASVSVTAGGKFTVNLNTVNFSVDGGTHGGLAATLLGSGATGKATLADNQSVTLSAVGTFTVNGADNLNLIAGVFAATGTDAAVTLAGGAGTATVNSGITVKGSSVTVHRIGTKTVTPRTTVTDIGLTETGKVTVIGTPQHLSVSPLSMAPVDDWSRAPMEIAPSTGAASFGQPQSVGTMSGVSLTPSVSSGWVLPGNSGVQISVTPLSLADLGSQGLVVQLVTIAGLPADGELAPSPAQADGTDFSSGSSLASLGSADCRAVFQGDAGRCRTSAAHTKR